MDPNELIRFLNVLRLHVPGYWRGRIDEVIRKMNGQIKHNPYKENLPF